MHSLPYPWTLFSLHHQLRVDLSLQLNPGVEPSVHTLYPFQIFFSQKAKERVTSQKWTPANNHVDLPIRPNLGVEPAVYTLYPFQTFFSQKAKERAANQKFPPTNPSRPYKSGSSRTSGVVGTCQDKHLPYLVRKYNRVQ